MTGQASSRSLPGKTATAASLGNGNALPTFATSRGHCLPFGATPRPGGVNFAVFSRHAQRVHLVLFREGQEEPIAEIPLDPALHKTGDVWHIFIHGLKPDLLYGYRVQGPFAPKAGHRFDPKVVVLDPYAPALSGGHRWGFSDVPHNGTGRLTRRGRLVIDEFDWEDDVPPATPLGQTILYELHVRGYRRHASSGVQHPGTFLGLCEKIPYLKSLGVTAVELMPVLEFDELDQTHRHPATGEPLQNYWGCSPLSFFAPKASYAAQTGQQLREFKELVKAFHRAGIEVILDVVYNHTCEGNENGPTISFRGLDNVIYYTLDREYRYYNFSGCGNTLNCNHPVVRDLIIGSLTYSGYALRVFSRVRSASADGPRIAAARLDPLHFAPSHCYDRVEHGRDRAWSHHRTACRTGGARPDQPPPCPDLVCEEVPRHPRRTTEQESSMKQAFLILSALLIAALPAAAADPPADLIILNGKVLTVDAQSTKAEAVAIRDGVFVLVGANAEARKLAGEKTRVIEAQGKIVVPGLLETHVHATGAARGEAVQPFVQLGSIGEIQEWVRRQAQKTPKGEWIQAPRVDMTRIKELRIPTQQELDAAAPDHPVVFNWQYANRQVQVLNSLALKTAQITKDTRAPARGKIRIGDDGQPTGVLEDAGALVSKFLARRNVPESEYLDSLVRLLGRYNEVGITSIFERNTGVDGYRNYQQLKASNRLTVRVTTTIGLRSDGSEEATEKFIRSLPFRFGDGDDWVKVGPLKIGVDGGVLYGTAYLREPYGTKAGTFYGFTDPSYQGDLRLSADKVKNIIRTGHRLGWQMCSHVTGDAGVDVVLDAVAAADRDSPIKERRYTLIHAYFPNPETARRAAQLGVCVDTQPAWYYKDADALSLALGGTRLNKFIGLKEWQQARVKVALNSDHMQGFDPNTSLNPYNPFLTMYTAVTRRTERGLVLGPDQCVSREEALRMMTLDAAYLGFEEKRRGSIEVGKLGDLAVLSDDLLTCAAERIKDIKAVLTVVGGKVVHESMP